MQKLLYCDILHQHPKIFPNAKFRRKIKICFGYFGWNFKKLMSYLKSVIISCSTCCPSERLGPHGPVQVSTLIIHHQLQYLLPFGPVRAIWVGASFYFNKLKLVRRAAITATDDGVFEISIAEFVNMQRFIQKQKNFKLGTKNTLFRYFWAAI